MVVMILAMLNKRRGCVCWYGERIHAPRGVTDRAYSQGSLERTGLRARAAMVHPTIFADPCGRRRRRVYAA